MLNSKKKLKRYCKATFNIFLVKIKFDDDKKKLQDKFYVKLKFYCLACKNYLLIKFFSIHKY